MNSSGTTQSDLQQVGVSLQPERSTSVQSHPLPVVIIARDTPDLARLMGAYLGRARLALLPDWNAATTLIKSLQTHNIGILAVLGFPDNPASIPLSAKHSRPDASPLRNDPQVASQTSPHASGGLFHQNVVVPFKAMI